MDKTKETQYQPAVTLRDNKGLSRLGIMSNWIWDNDPRKLVFMFARYKFVSKMLEGSDRVIEIGCADAFSSRIVRRAVNHLTCLDFDPVLLSDAKESDDPNHPITYIEHDMVMAPLSGEKFDAAYSLDVMEHIKLEDEDNFLTNISNALTENGTLIIGMPSIESQEYAAKHNRLAHVNCKTGVDLKAIMARYFHNVYLFSMNDEVVHTGFTPMAHYLFALCCSPRP